MDYPLHQAVLTCEKDEVERLLKHDVDPNAFDDHGQTAMHCAVFGGYYEIVDLLLSMGSDVNAIASDGVSPLWRAEDFGLDSIAELIRGYGGKSICQVKRADISHRPTQD